MAKIKKSNAVTEEVPENIDKIEKVKKPKVSEVRSENSEKLVKLIDDNFDIENKEKSKIISNVWRIIRKRY